MWYLYDLDYFCIFICFRKAELKIDFFFLGKFTVGSFASEIGTILCSLEFEQFFVFPSNKTMF